MNTESEVHSADGLVPYTNHYGPYEQSIGSSTGSSQTSIFSDASSASSSIATTISDDFRSTQEERLPEICYELLQYANEEAPQRQHQACPDLKQRPSYANVTSVPTPQHTNPRRSSLCRAQKPPPLVRQRDRTRNFVDNLVDSATQMVEVIWPLSVVPCRAEAGARGVLPLRTYIEETLKRSKTSYSTLQVALYYLVLIRPHVPETDFTQEQTVDCPNERALMCGRRMFLAALILASKYLQDRNYSAKAWSKMSGLKVCEINANERNFLSKINWKLHISKPAFEKWQTIVLRYSPNAPPSSPGWGVLCGGGSMWKRMIPLLTPELDNLPMMENKLMVDYFPPLYSDLASPATPTPTRDALKLAQLESTSQETTPTPLTVLPCLEPNPTVVPPMPTLARLGPLPTPVMTLQSVASSTPAASAYGSRRSSMCSAMAIAQKTGHNRSVIDDHFNQYPRFTRRPNSPYYSSPESMMSDNSRSSRSSSISSVSTASSAMAPRACLARQATCRNAGLLSSRPIKEEHIGSAVKPIIIDDDMEMVRSPMQADFSVSEKVLHAPHRHSRGPKHHAPQPVAACATEKSKKRSRTHGGHRRSELQEEVRYQLEESLDDDSMDLDDRITPPPAAELASSMLNCGPSLVSYRDVQPAATISGTWDYGRIPVQKNDGKKRTCCSATRNMSMSISPAPLYGEVA